MLKVENGGGNNKEKEKKNEEENVDLQQKNIIETLEEEKLEELDEGEEYEPELDNGYRLFALQDTLKHLQKYINPLTGVVQASDESNFVAPEHSENQLACPAPEISATFREMFESMSQKQAFCVQDVYPNYSEYQKILCNYDDILLSYQKLPSVRLERSSFVGLPIYLRQLLVDRLVAACNKQWFHNAEISCSFADLNRFRCALLELDDTICCLLPAEMTFEFYKAKVSPLISQVYNTLRFFVFIDHIFEHSLFLRKEACAPLSNHLEPHIRVKNVVKTTDKKYLPKETQGAVSSEDLSIEQLVASNFEAPLAYDESFEHYFQTAFPAAYSLLNRWIFDAVGQRKQADSNWQERDCAKMALSRFIEQNIAAENEDELLLKLLANKSAINKAVFTAQ